MKTDTKIITINHGPQFNGMISRIAFLVSLTSFILCIAALIQGSIGYALLALGALASAAPIFLDYRGIQIDRENNRIRQYVDYWSWKRGRWNTLNQFDKMILKWERYSYKSGTSMPILIAFGGETNSRTNDAYCVYLVNSGNKTRIELGDFDTHKKGKRFMAKYSKILNIPGEDKYQQRLEAAYQRRLDVESRRRR